MKKLVFGILVGSLILATSCRKEKDTNAIVTVVDASEQPVANADVRLYVSSASGPVRDGIDQTVSTNSSGVASFNFNDLYELGQAGFAVLDVDVNSGQATGIIKIEEETDNEQTIVCQTC